MLTKIARVLMWKAGGMVWLSFIIRYRIPLAIIGSVLAAYIYGLTQHSAGYYKGFAACDAAYIAAEKAANIDRKEVEHETRSMSNDELIDDLRFHGELRDANDI